VGGKLVRKLIAVVLPFAAFPGLAWAQSCFRPRPLPACESFMVVELSPERRVGRLTGAGLPRWEIIGSGALGGMVNVSRRWAIGAALVKVWRGEEEPGDDEASSKVGVVLRARRWLGKAVSVDLSGGLWRLRGARPALEATVEAGGVVGVTVGVRGDRLWPGSGEAYLGVRFSSYAAVAAGMIALLQAAGSIGD
jgi:hypothetical protein